MTQKARQQDEQHAYDEVLEIAGVFRARYADTGKHDRGDKRDTRNRKLYAQIKCAQDVDQIVAKPHQVER